jgi:tetratricopeptide (TPR) repeat protein
MSKRARSKRVKERSRAEASTLPSPWTRHDTIFSALLVLLVLAAYLPVCGAGYIWDDALVLTTNPCVIGPQGLKEIWTTAAADVGPLTISTFWFEHALWGLPPLPYHIVNVFWHAASAVVLWRVLLNLRVPGTWLGAALWGLHPVAVESVAWVSEMKNTESGFFYLLSILFFVRWLRTETRANDSNYGLSLLFAALAMTSKSSTVVLPLVLGLCAWWMDGRCRRQTLLRLWPLFLMSLAAGLLSLWTQARLLAVDPDPQLARSWPERLVTAGDAIWFYLGKLIWPHPLLLIYPRWKIDAHVWFSYLPLVGVLAVSALLWLKRGTWARPFFLAWSYFIVALLPVVGLLNNTIFDYSLVFDHFQYLAAMGPLALAGAGLVRLANEALPGKTLLACGLGAALLLLLGTLTLLQSRFYKDVETLWTHTLKYNPDCWAAYSDLSNLFVLRGEADKALDYVHKSLALNSNSMKAHNNLGNALLLKGRVDEAITEYDKALAINNAFPIAHSNLGNALMKKGRVDQAIAEYSLALRMDPNIVDTENNLGAALLQEGKLDEAIAHFRRALQLDSSYPKVSMNLGDTLMQKGDLDAAQASYQRALDLKPDNADAVDDIGFIFLQKGQVDTAVSYFQKALALDPHVALTHNNLGAAYLQLGQIREAVDQFLQSLEINPSDTRILYNLAWIFSTCPQAELRQGAKAIELATRANQLSGGKVPLMLAALGAAYAENGQFPLALQTAQRAAALAAAQGNAGQVAAIRDQIKSYEKKFPLRDPSLAARP